MTAVMARAHSGPSAVVRRRRARIAVAGTGGWRLGVLVAAVAVGACSGGNRAATTSTAQPIYVSDERGDQVLVIDAANGGLLRTIKAGIRPRGIHLSADGRTLYVAVSGSPIGGPGVDDSKLPPADRAKDGIAVIDTADGTVQRVLKAGDDPESFALAPDGATLLVSNEDAAAVSIVDVNRRRPTRSIKVGDEPEGVATARDGALVYVACERSDAVMAFDVASGRKLASIPLKGRPRTLLASKDGRVIYVAIENAGQVAVIDAATARLIRLIAIARGSDKVRPMGLVEAPGGKTLFVSTGRGGTVIEIDPAAGAIVRTIAKVGARPWGIASTADGTLLVTANGPSGDISLIDRTSGVIRARYKAGLGPWGVAVPR